MDYEVFLISVILRAGGNKSESQTLKIVECVLWQEKKEKEGENKKKNENNRDRKRNMALNI